MKALEGLRHQQIQIQTDDLHSTVGYLFVCWLVVRLIIAYNPPSSGKYLTHVSRLWCVWLPKRLSELPTYLSILIAAAKSKSLLSGGHTAAVHCLSLLNFNGVLTALLSGGHRNSVVIKLSRRWSNWDKVVKHLAFSYVLPKMSIIKGLLNRLFESKLLS